MSSELEPTILTFQHQQLSFSQSLKSRRTKNSHNNNNIDHNGFLPSISCSSNSTNSSSRKKRKCKKSKTIAFDKSVVTSVLRYGGSDTNGSDLQVTSKTLKSDLNSKRKRSVNFADGIKNATFAGSGGHKNGLSEVGGRQQLCRVMHSYERTQQNQR